MGCRESSRDPRGSVAFSCVYKQVEVGLLRFYIKGKHGIEKQPFQLPDYIAATGIEKIRQVGDSDQKLADGISLYSIASDTYGKQSILGPLITSSNQCPALPILMLKCYGKHVLLLFLNRGKKDDEVLV